MCTLSIISLTRRGRSGRGLRVIMNRDERRDRPEAWPPRWRTLDSSTHAVWPTDPSGGGTWIAASNSGLVLCLLNLNLEPAPSLPPDLLSRGLIIPKLIDARDGSGAMADLARTPLGRFAPFRLLAADLETDGTRRIQISRWDGRALSMEPPASVPLCLVSSGLGDSKVRQRLELFREVVEAQPTVDVQDRFHRHAWPDRPEISVLMSRDEARTVSITSVEMLPIGPQWSVRMKYEPILESLQPGKNRAAGAHPVVLLGRKG